MYAFYFKGKITTGHDGIPEQKLVRHNLLLVKDMESLDSAMPNNCDGMVICRERSVSQRRLRIIPVYDTRLAIYLVPSGRSENYFLNQYTSLEAYNQIY